MKCGWYYNLDIQVMSWFWESSTNKAGLVDVDTGTVCRGVELLPLRNKFFFGWYDCVAVQRLTGLTDKQREILWIRHIRSFKYEKNQLDMTVAAIDFDDKYLAFRWSHEEDLSFIFYS